MPELPEELVEKATRAMHDAYEQLAPSHGYKTRDETAVEWHKVPANNRRLMLASVRKALDAIDLSSILRERREADEWIAKAEREVDRALEERDEARVRVLDLEARLPGGPVAATPPTVLDGHETAVALPSRCPYCPARFTSQRERDLHERSHGL